MNSRKKFVYGLQPVLKQREWQLDEAVGELNQINQTIRFQEQELNDVLRRVAETLESIRGSSLTHGELIMREQFSMGNRHLAQLSEIQNRKQKEIERSREQQEQLIANVVAKRGGVKVLETDKERKQDEYERNLGSRDAMESDERWLITKHQNG
jgi:flagellar biosynthesis chaperone FliJ